MAENKNRISALFFINIGRRRRFSEKMKNVCFFLMDQFIISFFSKKKKITVA